MPRIKMPNGQCNTAQYTFAEAFALFCQDAAARGLADKTIDTYHSHLKSISHHFAIDIALSSLTKKQLNEMVVSMRKAGLSSNSINSYTRVVATFLRWCEKQGYCSVAMPAYKAEETIKETYTDDELTLLLVAPAPSCRFSTYRTWVIINFLLNCGCRAATIRYIHNSDVFLDRRQIITRSHILLAAATN